MARKLSNNDCRDIVARGEKAVELMALRDDLEIIKGGEFCGVRITFGGLTDTEVKPDDAEEKLVEKIAVKVLRAQIRKLEAELR